MSTGRALALATLAGASFAFLTAMLPEKWLKAFRKWVNGLGARAHPSIAGFWKAVVGGLALIVVFAIGSVVLFVAQPNALPVGTSDKRTEQYIHILLTILKWAGLVIAGLIVLTCVVAAIVGVLWGAAKLISVLPLTPRFYAVIGMLIAIAIFVPTWNLG